MAEGFSYTTFETLELTHDDGILIVRLHTDGDVFRFSMDAHAEWVRLWEQVPHDPDIRAMIITGTGDQFSAPRLNLPGGADRASLMTPVYWQRIMRESRDHVLKLLEVPVPVIAAVNGPMANHCELALLNDIVIATPDATIADNHMSEQVIPTDLQHILLPALMGRLRSSYFFYTDQKLTADVALSNGLYNEVVPAERLMERAVQIARWILRQPDSNLRYLRRVMTHELRAQVNALMEYGLAVEGLAIMSVDWTDWKVEPDGLPPLDPPATG